MLILPAEAAESDDTSTEDFSPRNAFAKYLVNKIPEKYHFIKGIRSFDSIANQLNLNLAK